MCVFRYMKSFTPVLESTFRDVDDTKKWVNEDTLLTTLGSSALLLCAFSWHVLGDRH